MSQQTALLLLGSNIGDRKANLLKATELLENKVGNILRKSEIIETKPVGFCSVNYFLNFALRINTSFSPIQLLKVVKEIEKSMGRTEDSSSRGYYTDRIIDIDIVKYSGIIFKCRTLEIPHLKHLEERDFSKIVIDQIET